jgi:hypothetical protein
MMLLYTDGDHYTSSNAKPLTATQLTDQTLDSEFGAMVPRNLHGEALQNHRPYLSRQAGYHKQTWPRFEQTLEIVGMSRLAPVSTLQTATRPL